MAGIVIDIRTDRLEEEEFRDVCEQLLDYVIDISPVDTGYFASQWDLEMDYPQARLVNDTPYAEFLDDGWSKQAPNGITRPALDYLRNLVS